VVALQKILEVVHIHNYHTACSWFTSSVSFPSFNDSLESEAYRFSFLVIFPAIAQRLVDNASLPIVSAAIMNPTANSVEYSMVATLNIPKGVTVDLKPITLSLYTPDIGPSDPYIKVNIPEYHLKGKTTLTISNQTAEILDEPQFEKFLQSAVNSVNFTMSAYGTTAAYLGRLKAKLTLKKNVELPGKSMHLFE
jgi:hypothetical protein